MQIVEVQIRMQRMQVGKRRAAELQVQTGSRQVVKARLQGSRGSRAFRQTHKGQQVEPRRPRGLQGDFRPTRHLAKTATYDAIVLWHAEEQAGRFSPERFQSREQPGQLQPRSSRS